MALTFDIGANERAAVKAVKNLGEAVEDVDENLDDLGSNKGLSKIDDGASKAKQGLRGVGDEAGQTAREVTASFDGSAESVAGAFQEVAANAFSGFGPAGLIAGAAIAAAFGTIVETINTATEAYNEARDSAYDFAFAAADLGGFGDVTSRIKELTDSTEKMKNVQDIATISGWDQVAVIQAMATGTGLPALTEAFNEGANSTSIASGRALELTQALGGVKDGFETGAAAATVTAEALYDVAVKSGVATGEVDEVGNAIYRLPNGKEVVVDANVGQAHENLDALENRQLPPKGVRVTASIDTSAWDYWQPSSKYGTVYTTRGGTDMF